MSFTEHQLRGSLYSKPKEYCTCDRCGCVRATEVCTAWEGPLGEQHICKDTAYCLRMKEMVDAQRRKH